jgi:hypothetical protein
MAQACAEARTRLSLFSAADEGARLIEELVEGQRAKSIHLGTKA